jgi:phosphatidylglycerol:prolipoprotein diacylglycerol transferase
VLPRLIDLGFLAIPTYGVLLVTGIALGIWLAGKRATAAGLPGERVADLAFWVVLWGLVGAKVLLLVTSPSYLTSLENLWWLLRSGGVFYGGFIGAAIAAFVLLRRYRIPFRRAADALAPSLALGHFFGRLGCFAAGCCYGAACERPWAVTFTHPLAHSISGTPLHVPLHPVQLYEAVFNLANYGLLAWLYKRRPAPGIVLATYLMTYGVGRFVIEHFRGDADRGFVLGGMLSTSQAIAIGMVVAGIALAAWSRRQQEADSSQPTAHGKKTSA